MKMLTTQLSGLLDRIAKNNEEAIEETARLLAQATVGEGRVIIAGLDELDTVCQVAMHSAEPFIGAVQYNPEMTIGHADRVWVFTRSAEHPQALELACSLAAEFIPFAVVTPEKTEENKLFDLATTYISTSLTRGLLPGENGERIVQPHALAALFIYEAVKIAYDEMLSDE
ncbi:DUF2529 family protein [Sporosarcina pasteurii]|uniref:Protein of uncharacterized function (DUF2529) n=1 Tax=Sporosarcina pasteurii TaxID=1474 RepID=A0A380BCJ4_SPOPA|nr:DUF2529 family protein [Sporosarcina pasteurii]MDS9472296.1 DUF2529 family protein [Sporosarcina pasteurii]QBQ06277.1 DUF2529 family protein [Sporosarcina pasteurii]SUI99082.1 Protein of uncharacterised function (DUF2529) [Sporosarcina pasteurii]